MSKLTEGFDVEVISLNDISLITAGTTDPHVVGYSAPYGSMYLYANGSSSNAYFKVGPNDIDWASYVSVDAYTKAQTDALVWNWSTSISNKPTTLSGYGIIDGQPLNSKLTSISSLSSNVTGLVKLTNGVASVDSSAYLTGNQTITATGDVTGSGTTSIPLTLTSVGTAGTYTKVTTDAKGRVVSGSNPTTIAGYGITDAVTTLDGLTDVTITSPTANQTLYYNGTQWINSSTGGNAGSGHIVRTVASSIAAISGTTTIPMDNTTPLITKGTQIWSATITPSASTTKMMISATAYMDANSQKVIVMHIFRNNTPICSTAINVAGGSKPSTVSVQTTDAPATTSAVTYSCRVGLATSGTWYVNTDSAPYFNGLLVNNGYRITEIT